MKKSISRKIILMMVSFLFSILLLMTINNLIVNAKAKDERIIFNEQQHINLIKILQNKLNELHQISYRLNRLEDIRLFTKQEKEIKSLLADIDLLTDVLISGGEYENNIKINIYNQDLFTDKIIYQAFNKEFSSEIVELSPRLSMINDLSNHLVIVMKEYYESENEQQYREVNSHYKQLESLISRAIETANRAYLQVQERKTQLHQNMDNRIQRYNL
ncbi:hypothetical protein [Lentimicrobium sp. S6]|nr:hypothetical protein [Lentimicrobium sp. S6]NPD43936.1 hypothetical protein [Lentimicrobium sp. S6]